MERTVLDAVSETAPPVPVVAAGWVVDPDPDDAATVPVGWDRLVGRKRTYWQKHKRKKRTIARLARCHQGRPQQCSRECHS
jgi:hypothetical protein